MLFQRRYEKQMANIKKQNEGKKRTVDEENIQGMLEKHDTLAMIISALITIVPVALLFLLAICAAGYFFLVR
ncbi:MAG: hypothetical protein IJD39_06835 [Clostridia bacterium]|nr:hypothetical protein [Clostridia bacterium]